jgi:hypothetical protein
VQRSPEWREGVDDGVLVGVVAGDEVVLFESAQGGTEDLVRDAGGDGLGQVSVSVGASVESVHDWQDPSAVEDVEGRLGVQPVGRLRARLGRGCARPHRSFPFSRRVVVPSRGPIVWDGTFGQC